MKFQKYNQLGLNFTQYIKDNLYRVHTENFFSKFDKDFVKPYQEQWKWILNDEKNKNLFFTNTARKVADSIKLNKFEAKILKSDKDVKYTFLIDDKMFYRVSIKGGEILGMRVFTEEGSINYSSFKILPEQNLVVYPHSQYDYLNDKYFVEFIKLLIFTEYSELKETVLMPRQSVGTMKEGKYLNESDKNVVIVDSTWNNVIVRNEAFGVNGHFRLQPMGKNRLERKLIYIKEFIKDGYVRKSKKETATNKK
jgi:hypothetical protein